MMIEAPREQWLIDLRASLAEQYPAEFLEDRAYAIRATISWGAIGECFRSPLYEMATFIEAIECEIADMFDSWEQD